MRTLARRVVLLPDRLRTDTAAAGFCRSGPSAASPSRTADQRVCHEAVRRALAMRADCVQSVISYAVFCLKKKKTVFLFMTLLRNLMEHSSCHTRRFAI